MFFLLNLDRTSSSHLPNNLLPDVYPSRSNSAAYTPDLSRAFRVDAYLLAIVRTEDKRSKFMRNSRIFISLYDRYKRS